MNTLLRCGFMLSRAKWLMIVGFFLFVLSPVPAGGFMSQTSNESSVEATTLNNEAVAAAEASDFDTATQLLRRAIVLQPDLVVAHYNLARIYQAQGQFPRAIDAFKQSLRLNPAFTDAHHYLGIAYNTIERYEEAITCLNRALQLNPNRADSLSGLGFAYFMTGREQERSEERRVGKESRARGEQARVT